MNNWTHYRAREGLVMALTTQVKNESITYSNRPVSARLKCFNIKKYLETVKTGKEIGK